MAGPAEWAAPFADHFVASAEGRLHYVDSGRGTGTVVFVHGWSCSARFWRLQLPAFAAHWRVIAVDLPGHGRSEPRPAAYTPEYFARGLDAMLSDAGVQSAAFVGHSMGGTVARAYLQLHPERVTALVLVDPRSLLQGAGIGRTVAEKQELIVQLRGPEGDAVLRTDIDRMFVPSTPLSLRGEIQSGMMATNRSVQVSANEGLLYPIAWARWPSPIPVLALFRRPIPPEAQGAVRAMFPRADYVEWSGVGHFMMMERPAAFNALAIAFLQSAERAGRGNRPSPRTSSAP